MLLGRLLFMSTANFFVTVGAIVVNIYVPASGLTASIWDITVDLVTLMLIFTRENSPAAVDGYRIGEGRLAEGVGDALRLQRADFVANSEMVSPRTQNPSLSLPVSLHELTCIGELNEACLSGRARESGCPAEASGTGGGAALVKSDASGTLASAV